MSEEIKSVVSTVLIPDLSNLVNEYTKNPIYYMVQYFDYDDELKFQGIFQNLEDAILSMLKLYLTKICRDKSYKYNEYNGNEWIIREKEKILNEYIFSKPRI